MLRRLVVALAAIPLLFVSTTVAAPPPQAASATGCLSKQLALGEFNTFNKDGGKAWWTMQQLAAQDTATNGFAAEVLWVATDNRAADPPQTWVEMGITDGWEGANVTTFYSAQATDWDEPWHTYTQSRAYATPVVGHGYKFVIDQFDSDTYQAIATIGGGETLTWFWDGHHDPTKQVAAGLEATCTTAQVDRTNVTNVSTRANDTQAWGLVDHGALFDYTTDPDGGLGWCSYPTAFRYYLNSAIGTSC